MNAAAEPVADTECHGLRDLTVGCVGNYGPIGDDQERNRVAIRSASSGGGEAEVNNRDFWRHHNEGHNANRRIAC